jgi:hypothetical protein
VAIVVVAGSVVVVVVAGIVVVEDDVEVEVDPASTTGSSRRAADAWVQAVAPRTRQTAAASDAVRRAMSARYRPVIAARYPRTMPAPLEPSVGWGVLHLFCKTGPLAEAEAVAAAVKAAEADEVQVVPVAVLGHKCDLAFMALGPDLWRLRRLQTELAEAGLDVVDSYVSLTELSEYSQGVPEEMK